MTSHITAMLQQPGKVTSSLQKTNHSILTALPINSHPMDAFIETITPMPELSGGCFFIHKRSCSEEQSHSTGNSHTCSGRGHQNSRPSSVGELSPENNSTSSFRQEMALLEQVLRKEDGSRVPSSSCATQARSETQPSNSLFEDDIYISEILGGNGVTPQPLAIKNEENDEETPLYHPVAFNHPSKCSQESDKQTDPQAFSTNPLVDLSMSFSLGTVSYADSKCVESGHGSSNLQRPTFSNVTRLQENEESPIPTNNSSSQRGSVVSPSVPFSLSDLHNFRSLSSDTKDKSLFSITRDLGTNSSNRNENENDTSLFISRQQMNFEDAAHSPISDSSMSGIGTHPDLYENLSPCDRKNVDNLKGKISCMPRRKLRESLAKFVSIDEVEPLMSVNRDELAGMLGLGVTTWKMFVHHTLGIPRWPARALKSQKVKEKKLQQKKLEAEKRGEYDVAERIEKELIRLRHAHMKRRKLFRNNGKLRVSNGGISKQ